MANQLLIPVVTAISDEDRLYYRVLKRFVSPQGVISNEAFKDRHGMLRHKMSTDAKKLTSAPSCIERVEPANLRNLFRLACMVTSTPRGLEFRVWNEPEFGNYAHCSVEGENTDDKADDMAADSWIVDIQSDSCFEPLPQAWQSDDPPPRSSF